MGLSNLQAKFRRGAVGTGRLLQQNCLRFCLLADNYCLHLSGSFYLLHMLLQHCQCHFKARVLIHCSFHTIARFVDATAFKLSFFCSFHFHVLSIVHKNTALRQNILFLLSSFEQICHHHFRKPAIMIEIIIIKIIHLFCEASSEWKYIGIVC